MVVAAITMMLEYVGAAKLLGPQVCHHPLSADPQPIVQQHLLYMGWHRREPGQPLNHVFVSSATCGRRRAKRNLLTTSFRIQGDWIPSAEESPERKSPSCTVMHLGARPRSLGSRKQHIYEPQ